MSRVEFCSCFCFSSFNPFPIPSGRTHSTLSHSANPPRFLLPPSYYTGRQEGMERT